jgi:hypothetical protein
MNIYLDKCPHCGTHISIPEATRCPGCMSSVYYGWYGNYPSGYYYYPSEESRDAYYWELRSKAYWDSEEGKKSRDKHNITGDYWTEEKANELRLAESKAAAAAAAAAEAPREKKRQARQDLHGFLEGLSTIGVVFFISVPVVWIFGGHEWSHFGYYGWTALGVVIVSAIYLLWNN